MRHKGHYEQGKRQRLDHDCLNLEVASLFCFVLPSSRLSMALFQDLKAVLLWYRLDMNLACSFAIGSAFANRISESLFLSIVMSRLQQGGASLKRKINEQKDFQEMRIEEGFCCLTRSRYCTRRLTKKKERKNNNEIRKISGSSAAEHTARKGRNANRVGMKTTPLHASTQNLMTYSLTLTLTLTLGLGLVRCPSDPAIKASSLPTSRCSTGIQV